MNTPVLHRKRIERYAQLLDEASGARRHHSRSQADDDLTNLVSLSHRLTAATPEVSVRPGFRAETRAFLLATAEREGIGESAAPQSAVGRAVVGPQRAAGTIIDAKTKKRPITAGRGRARGAILVGLAVGTLALSGISAASGDALPGDTLYGMKRSAENTQLALAGSNVSRGQLYLEFARTRLSEAAAVHGQKVFPGVIDTMDQQTLKGVNLLFTDAVQHHDTAALDTVEQFVVSQQAQLSDLLAQLPAAQHDALVTPTNILGLVGERAGNVRAALNCTSTVSYGTPDIYGPNPSCPDPASPGSIPATGSSGGPAHKPGQGTSTAPAVKPSAGTTTGTNGGQPAVATTTAPAPEASADGGLLGDIGHLLGGLVGH